MCGGQPLLGELVWMLEMLEFSGDGQIESFITKNGPTIRELMPRVFIVQLNIDNGIFHGIDTYDPRKTRTHCQNIFW